MAKISITRGLVQLTMLDSRITKQIGYNLDTGRVSVDDKTVEIPGKEYAPVQDLQSIKDLIVLRSDIKKAIMISNMNTTVTIDGDSMSVVDAIELKSTIKYNEQILRKLQQNLASVTQASERHNVQMEKQLTGILEAMAQGGTMTNVEIEAVAGPFRKNNIASVDVKKYDNATDIKLIEESIENFKAEVDFILSESNAITLIEV